MSDEEAQSSDFIPISPLLLIHDAGRKFDTYIRVGDTNRYVLYAKDGMLTKKHKEKLVESKIEFLYIKFEDKISYEEYIEENYGKILLTDEIPINERTKIFYNYSNDIIKETFDSKLPRQILTDDFYNRVSKIVETNQKFLSQNPITLNTVSKLISHNYKTYSHCLNVSIYATCFLNYCNEKDDLIKNVGVGCLLHDIGKISIPQYILKKNGPLTNSERELINTHPINGVGLSTSMSIDPIAANCILFHHEKLDGSGYPSGLLSESIPEYVKIVTICDIYDALSSDRPYSKAYTPFESLKIIMKDVDRGKLDLELYKIFVNMLSGSKIII